MIDSQKLRERTALSQNNPSLTPTSFNIPMEVWINPFLTSTEKEIFVILQNTAQSSYGCKVTNEFLHNYDTTRKRSIITNAISNLQKYRYINVFIKRTSVDHASRSIFIDLHYHARYRKAIRFYWDNYHSMYITDINVKLKEIITNALNEKIDLSNQTTDFPVVKNIDDQTHDQIGNQTTDFPVVNTNTISNTNVKTKETNKLVPSVSNIGNVRKNANVMDDQKRETHNGEEETPVPTLIKHRKEKPSIVAILANTNKKPSSIRKLNRPKLIPAPKEPSPSLSEQASNGMKADAEKKKQKYKVMPIQNIPAPILETMDLWEQLGFKIPNKDKATKGFNDTIQYLKKIQTGKLIADETRKFSLEEVKDAMIRFSMLAFDDCGCHTPENRKKFAKKTLCHFLYSPAYGDTLQKYPDYTQSWFVKCHDMKEEPKKQVNPNTVDDLHPNIKNKLVGFYYDYALAGLKKRLSEAEENKFREAANKICVLYDQNKERFAGVNGYHEMADMLCQSIYQSYGKRTTMVHPGSFCSSNAMAGMIKFMNEKGCIPDADSLIEFR